MNALQKNLGRLVSKNALAVAGTKAVSHPSIVATSVLGRYERPVQLGQHDFKPAFQNAYTAWQWLRSKTILLGLYVFPRANGDAHYVVAMLWARST